MHTDILIVGAGPSGAAAAYWLASRGHKVLAVEKKRFPRDKTCGDGLTPRAVRQLHDLGLAERLGDFQRYDGLRSMGHGVTLELQWPDHPDFPPYGYVVRRAELGTEAPHRQRGEAVRGEQHDGVVQHVAAVVAHAPSRPLDRGVATTLT